MQDNYGRNITCMNIPNQQVYTADDGTILTFDNGTSTDTALAAFNASLPIGGAPFIAMVKTMLAANDAVAIRCTKAGVAYPSDWLAYDVALRALIVAGSGSLPTQPSYPPNT